MCGICGYTDNQPHGVLQAMLKRMAHRGPDDSGYIIDGVDGCVTLGMARLSIIDLSGGHQPIPNEDGSIWVVFNGEIYNYIELREELERAGHSFKTMSDTETIVHAYEQYGIDFLHKLNGMFAIAIWDKRTETLMLARDRFGVKPLCYMEKNKAVVFASEINTMLCHPLTGREIDHEALSHYFALRNIPAPFTVYKNIRVLLPGHALIKNKTGTKIVNWYDLNMNAAWQDKDEDALIERIDEILRDSVRLRLRADVSYGAFLSGGIDSSTVVAIMSQYSSKPVQTFSLAFADMPAHKNDPYFARIVASQYATAHHECVMSWSDLQQGLSAVICHLGQPFAGVISSYWLSKYMSQHVKVALSGDGADDMFASYGHHRLVWPIAAARMAKAQGQPSDGLDYGFFNNRRDFVETMSAYEPWQWRLAYTSFMEEDKAHVFSKKGKELFLPYSTTDFLKNIYLSCNDKADELNKMLYLDINTLLHNEILFFNDMLSMASSLEVRTPFLDYRMVELAASIPGSLKIKGLTLKYILRHVAARYVPKEILDRPKEGFVLPKNTWLRQGLSSMVREVLSAERLSIHGYFDTRYVDSLVKRFIEADETLTYKVWTLMIFQIWLESCYHK
ncbi:MAG: asparagine synthase (glutamine-hydrolyzing) [Nitrospirota bacterium]